MTKINRPVPVPDQLFPILPRAARHPPKLTVFIIA
jgi:hypothetical protein